MMNGVLIQGKAVVPRVMATRRYPHHGMSSLLSSFFSHSCRPVGDFYHNTTPMAVMHCASASPAGLFSNSRPRLFMFYQTLPIFNRNMETPPSLSSLRHHHDNDMDESESEKEKSFTSRSSAEKDSDNNSNSFPPPSSSLSSPYSRLGVAAGRRMRRYGADKMVMKKKEMGGKKEMTQANRIENDGNGSNYFEKYGSKDNSECYENSKEIADGGWTDTQHAYRQLMKALRDAFYHDRAQLFWSRHRVKVEIYKYATLTDKNEVKYLCQLCKEIADFVTFHMKVSVERIQHHNDTMLKLPVSEAKRYREEYIKREGEHQSWCKQKIKQILQRRPPPPFPFS